MSTVFLGFFAQNIYIFFVGFYKIVTSVLQFMLFVHIRTFSRRHFLILSAFILLSLAGAIHYMIYFFCKQDIFIVFFGQQTYRADRNGDYIYGKKAQANDPYNDRYNAI